MNAMKSLGDSELEDFENGIAPARYDAYNLYARTGFSPRTIHYYVQRRLIPHAIGSGPAARYTYEHVVRLKALEALKKERMTLREIGVIFDGSTVRELDYLVGARDMKQKIANMRRGLRSIAPPNGSESLMRVEITDGVELRVSPKYHARAAARLGHLERAIREILRVDDQDDPPGDP